MKWSRFIGLLIFVGTLFSTTACDITSTPSADEPTVFPGLTPTIPKANEAAVLSSQEAMHPDGQQYVKDLGVSLEEAIRRLQVQNEIGRLRATLRANEPDTFAGLWLQHQPEFRIMVHFTQNGKSTVRPYIEDKAWVDLVEVRPARVTLSSLEAVLAETGRILDKLDFKVSFSLNEPENRVEVYVTDQPWFEGELQKANLRPTSLGSRGNYKRRTSSCQIMLNWSPSQGSRFKMLTSVPHPPCLTWPFPGKHRSKGSGR
jgi:hypothetical protein